METKPGQWYFGVKCDKCGQVIAFAQDLSEGTQAVRFTGPGSLAVPCPACGHKGRYTTARVELFRTASSQ